MQENNEMMASKGKIKECQILEQTIYEMKVKKNNISIQKFQTCKDIEWKDKVQIWNPRNTMKYILRKVKCMKVGIYK